MSLEKSASHEKEYIDTDVWFAYLTVGKYPEEDYDTASLIFDSIMNSEKKIAVTSHLQQMELIGIFRTKVTRKEKFDVKLSNKPDIANRINRKIEQITTRYLKKSDAWSQANKLIVATNTLSLSDFHKQILELQRIITGELEDRSSCSVCRKPRNSYEYKVLGHYDLQHAIIARDAGATVFHTFDRSYPVLNGHQKFINMRPALPPILFKHHQKAQVRESQAARL